MQNYPVGKEFKRTNMRTGLMVYWTIEITLFAKPMSEDHDEMP